MTATDSSREHTSPHREPTFTLRLPPASTSISVARSVLRRTVTFRDDDSESRFLTAFTDLLINAIEEHQRQDISDTIAVTVAFGEEQHVSIVDVGDGYEPTTDATLTSAVSPNVHTDEMLSSRGRGVLIATALVAGIEVTSSSRGTTVTLPLSEVGAVQ